MSREGGNVRVVPEGACEGVQNRPPWTKPPSRYQNTLPGQNHPPARLGVPKSPSGDI